MPHDAGEAALKCGRDFGDLGEEQSKGRVVSAIDGQVPVEACGF